MKWQAVITLTSKSTNTSKKLERALHELNTMAVDQFSNLMHYPKWAEQQSAR